MRARALSAVVCIAVAAVGAGVASASTAATQRMVSYTNAARAHHGLRGLVVRSDLTSTARRWAAWMASHRTLAHNPGLTRQVCCWRDLGENVGRGASAASVQRAFMASPEHRANILSTAYTQVGVGTARGADGRLYVDVVFRRPASSSSTRTSSTTARSSPAVRPQPRAVSPLRVTAPVSRSRARQPRAAAAADVLLVRRIAWTRRRLAPAADSDPVRRAFLFATALRAIAR